MEPLFSIQIIQEKNILQIILQVLSPIAIIAASLVAASFANKQYRDNKKKKARYLKSLLKTLHSYISLSIESLKVKDKEIVLKHLKMLNNHAGQIIQTLETGRLDFASCTSYKTLHETNYIVLNYWDAIEVSFSEDPANWEKDKERLTESYSLLLKSIERAIEHHK
jgi:hypothetical protein